MILLPTAYLGNLHYYAKLLTGTAQIDLHEPYVKQSYRNRCEILCAQGPCALSVPVHYSSRERMLTRDIRIDNTKRWQHTHWQAIVSAYRNAPYFDHYEEHFAPLYARAYTFLVELNETLGQTLLQLLAPDIVVTKTDHHLPVETRCDPGGEAAICDLRGCFSPKARLRRPDPTFTPPRYYQVFSDSLPFAPNLSILDLLFCEGPAARALLAETIRR